MGRPNLMSPRILCSLLLPLLAVPAGAVPQPGGDKKSEAPSQPVAASAEAANAIKGFKFDAGLKVELWAAEPLLGNPVSFSTDEQGRWYIAESYRQERGIEDNRSHAPWLNDDIASRSVEDRLAMIHRFYPEPEKFHEKFEAFEDRITRVEDSTGSGHADKSSIFADGFRDPLDGTGAGILVRGSVLWWTCIPNLWHFRVPAGEGKAEEREKLLTGFGVHFALRGHDMHGLRFGPDGKLYFSIGDRGINVVTKEGKRNESQDTGSIMRCNPDGTGFEVYSTGVRNPQELAFDELGNLFTGDNNSDLGDAARFEYLVEGGDCGWRMGFQYLSDRGPWNREKLWDVKEALKAKYIMPPVANLSNGPSGLAYNPGTGLSDKYKGRFYLSDFRGGANNSVVHEIAIEPEGAFFKLKERRDFVKGILTTDVDFGVDGGLYVLDWVESWGGVGKGRIYKFTDPAANTELQAQTKKLISEGMTKRPPAELGSLLAHPDQRVRQAAQFELATRGAASIPVLTQAAQHGANTLARIHGIWGLGQLAGTPTAPSLQPLAALLADGDAEVRAQAFHVLGDHKVPLGLKYIAGLKDAAARPQMFAALALGKLGDRTAVEPLFAFLAANDDRDPVLRHAGVMGLATSATAAQLAAKSMDASTAVRIGALVALRKQKDPAIAAYLTDKDAEVVLEAARAIHDVPIEGAMPALAKLTTRQELHDANLLSRAIDANYKLGKTENAVALATFAADSAEPEQARRVALDALLNWGSPAPRDRILNIHRPIADRGPGDAVTALGAVLPKLLKDSPASVQELSAQAASKLAIPSAADPLFDLAMELKTSPAPRIAAIQALATLKDARLPKVARAAMASKDATVRTQGLQALAGADPGESVKLIGEIINTGSTVEKQGALAALAQIKRPEVNALLGTLMDRLIAGGAAPEIQLDIVEAARKADTAEMKQKLKQYDGSLPASDALAAYRVSLKGGSEERGRKIFREKAETQCLRCHKCEMGDSQVGPDLTHVAGRKDREYILESIVYPNKQIAEGFETVVLTLKDKNVIVGRLAKTEPAALQIETMDDKGKPKTMNVPVAQIESRISAPSPMPENLRDFLSKGEIRDLVEYLAARK